MAQDSLFIDLDYNHRCLLNNDGKKPKSGTTIRDGKTYGPLSLLSRETVRVLYTLSAIDYDVEYDRGTFTYFDGEAIRTLLNTIARVGVIDTNLLGSNGWRSGYAVLHEQWIAQIGVAFDGTNYFAAVSDAHSTTTATMLSPDSNRV